MKEKWTNDLQKKMANYEVPTIPDGLWEEIDSALPSNTQRLTPITHHPSSTTHYWRKACAAILLLLAIPTALFFLYNSHTEEDGKALVETSPIAPTPQPQPDSHAKEGTAPTHNAPIAQAKAASLPPKPCLVLASNPAPPAPKEEQEKHPEEQEQATTPPIPTPTAQAPQSPTASPQPSAEASITAQAQQSEDIPLFKKEKHENHLYLAMNVSGSDFSLVDLSFGNSGDQANYSIDNGYPGFDPKYDNTINDPGHQKSDDEITYHDETHHRPITFGLQVGIPVTEDWSLVTGLAYTYLHSEFTDFTRYHRTDTDQNLHFIGIPVQMNYKLYNNRHCNIYLGTGGRIDFGVSGKTDTKSHLSHLPVNYSLKAAAGLQVRLFKSLNIYTEPTLQYNIPGSTRYKTYYTEHKTMFDLQLGIRFTP